MLSSAKNRPLVTVLGASGFLGAAVTAELIDLPVRLRLVSHERRLPLPASSAEVHLADLTDPRAVRDAVDGADTIIHLAAQLPDERSWRDPGSDSARLSTGLLDTLVRSVRGRPPIVVFASTVQASAPAGLPLNDYVREKIAAEQLLGEATRNGAVRGIVLRPATVYGRTPITGATGRGVVAAMARRAFADEPITMWHDGTVERDLVHVTDAARAFVAATRAPEALSGGRWPVGTGRPARLGEVFRTLAELVAARTGRPAVPVVTVPPPDWADATDFGNVHVDPSSFAAAAGWQPLVRLHDGLAGVADALSS
ncbi:dTDP-4-keto-6-deoxy-L-hexose 4-reductase [Streptomyces rishiriensis]|uniref:dTDP-4-keto-6-deoxy-L-hexose 4-reductase n=1 Tax=Streptomyces rishiriensis TaxID=68264 RepID=A0ABU0P2P3_STRRH|nr:NAD-dependent epimerase/dehydratase [Streptomyces rishiriensis]MDQ0585660.1 dTDP-4-keto-6-deoxy-L-hexose 4-reductase [Streptomyces rishiriensis]